jgi:hypothetical protein
MEANTKKYLLIGGSLLLIGGVAYTLWKKSRDAKGSSVDSDQALTPDSTPSGETSTPSATTTAGSGTTTSSLPSELQNSASIKKFQDFMDSVGSWVKGSDGKYKKLNKGAGYGNAGASTKAAFDVYGDLYRVFVRSGAKGRLLPLGVNQSASVDVDLSNGHIARYQQDKKFVDFSKNYGSAENTGMWANGGRKIILTYGPKKGKTLDTQNLWETLKALIS